MRKPLMAALMGAVLLPVSAFAQDASPEPAERAAQLLSDPDNQAQAAATVDALSEVLLQMPVGTMVEAMSRIRGADAPDIPRDAKLGELLGEDGDVMRARLVERLPELMSAMAGMSEGFGEILPQLREAARRLPRNLPAE